MANIDLIRRKQNIRTLKAGETIFAEGDAADSMFVVETGSVDILKDQTLLETISPGGFFGEMGLVEGKPRSARAVCKTDCGGCGRIWKLERKDRGVCSPAKRHLSPARPAASV